MVAYQSKGLTLLDAFETTLRTHGARVALRSKRGGQWQGLSWEGWHERSRTIAKALLHRGVTKGDRVLLFSSSREEWALLDLAIMMTGAIVVAVHEHVGPEELEAVVRETSPTMAFVENVDLYRRSPSLATRHRQGMGVVLVQGSSASIGARHEGADALPSLEALMAEALPSSLDGALQASRATVVPSDPAAIYYTSGTTGEPKGVVLSHRAMVAATESVLASATVTEQDSMLLFLPLGHIFARMMLAVQVRVGFTTAFAESIGKALENAEEVGPTLVGCAPSLVQRIRDAIMDRVSREGEIQREITAWALEVGGTVGQRRLRGEALDLGLRLRRRYAERLVLRKLRHRFGGKLHTAFCGGAPLPPELSEWLLSLGVLVLEGYGLTEACGVVTLNTRRQPRFGTAGRPVPTMEVALSPEGEVRIRGAHLMDGYWHASGGVEQPHLDGEGWFATGDLGAVDAEGYLRILERKRDVIVGADGTRVSPSRIEGRLEALPWVARAAVFPHPRGGLLALIHGGAASAERGDASSPFNMSDEALRVALRERIDGFNAKAGPSETIVAFALIDEDMASDEGVRVLGKWRRSALAHRYRALLSAAENPEDGGPVWTWTSAAPSGQPRVEREALGA